VVRKPIAKNSRPASKASASIGISPDDFATGPFRPGSMVLATLREPREKVWGALLGLNPAGVSLQGIELSAFDDATTAVRAGEPLRAAVVFFPMCRIERIAMDLPEGTLPSLSQRFQSRTGQEPAEALARAVNHKSGGRAGA
jgi:hypothetical protein